MASVNKVIIVGNLGADPEVRQFQNGGSVTHIRVATSERWTDKQTGEQKEQTEWHNISLFNRLGEVAAQYLRKGSSVYIEGSLHTRKWQDQQTGQDRYATEIRANVMQMLGGRQNGGDNGYQGGNFGGGYQTGGFQNQQGYQNQNRFNQPPMNTPQAYNNDYPYGNDGGFGSQSNFGNQNNQGYQNQGYPQANSFGSPNQMPQQPMAQAPITSTMAQPQAPRPAPQTEPKAPPAPQVSSTVEDDDMPF